MANRNCISCGQTILSSAAICPRCGIRLQGKGSSRIVIFALVGLMAYAFSDRWLPQVEPLIETIKTVDIDELIQSTVPQRNEKKPPRRHREAPRHKTAPALSQSDAAKVGAQMKALYEAGQYDAVVAMGEAYAKKGTKKIRRFYMLARQQLLLIEVTPLEERVLIALEEKEFIPLDMVYEIQRLYKKLGEVTGGGEKYKEKWKTYRQLSSLFEKMESEDIRAFGTKPVQIEPGGSYRGIKPYLKKRSGQEVTVTYCSSVWSLPGKGWFVSCRWNEQGKAEQTEWFLFNRDKIVSHEPFLGKDGKPRYRNGQTGIRLYPAK